jgi:hypothetical protein
MTEYDNGEVNLSLRFLFPEKMWKWDVCGRVKLGDLVASYIDFPRRTHVDSCREVTVMKVTMEEIYWFASTYTLWFNSMVYTWALEV